MENTASNRALAFRLLPTHSRLSFYSLHSWLRNQWWLAISFPGALLLSRPWYKMRQAQLSSSPFPLHTLHAYCRSTVLKSLVIVLPTSCHAAAHVACSPPPDLHAVVFAFHLPRRLLSSPSHPLFKPRMKPLLPSPACCSPLSYHVARCSSSTCCDWNSVAACRRTRAVALPSGQDATCVATPIVLPALLPMSSSLLL